MRTPDYWELSRVVEEHGLWDLGSAARSLCFWSWDLTSLIELLSLEDGITVLILCRVVKIM